MIVKDAILGMLGNWRELYVWISRVIDIFQLDSGFMFITYFLRLHIYNFYTYVYHLPSTYACGELFIAFVPFSRRLLQHEQNAISNGQAKNCIWLCPFFCLPGHAPRMIHHSSMHREWYITTAWNLRSSSVWCVKALAAVLRAAPCCSWLWSPLSRNDL